MPAITDVTTTDFTTPITFTHVSHDANNLIMTDIASPTSSSAAQLQLSRFAGKRGSPNRKYRLKYTFAYLETVSGSVEGYVAPPKVAYINTGIAEFTFNKRSTVAQCASIKSHLMTALGGSVDQTVTAQVMLHKAIIYDQFPF